MGLTLHVGARSSGIDRLLTNRWRAGGGLLVARDDHSLGQALDAATADGAVWGCRAGAFATLFGRTRELAGLPDSDRRDGLALRCAITEVLDPPGAGHVAALERLILELRAARATPEAFAAVAEARDSAPLRTAAQVYAAVADTPSPDAPEWETVDAATAVEIGPIYLVGFDDYATVEWALLQQLATRNPIEAGLAYEEGRATFAARHDRVARWMADADGVDHHDPAEPGDGIDLLERHLFEPQAPAVADGVEWLEAAGTDVSHRMAAERVVTALRAGTPPDQIAVVAPRLFEHLGGLRAALAEAGVASRHRVRLPFAASPLARALVSLFAFALDEDTPESVDRIVAWLRSPYSGAPAAEVDRFEAAMRRSEGTVTRGQLMARWQGEAMKPAIALRGLRAQPLRSQAAYLVKIGRERLAEAASSPPTATDLLDDAALAVLGGAAGELPEDDRPQGRGDVLPGRLGALLADLGFTEQVGPAGAVSLLDLSQARGLRFDHVIVLGLEDGVLPGSPAADPYMPDERLDLLPPRAAGTSEALLRFHAACACATGTLTLLRRFADDDGRELAPSPYWVESRRLLEAPEPTRRGVTGLIPAQPAVVSERDLDRRLALEHRPARPAIAAALGRRARVRGLTRGLAHERVRVTALESYEACAYGWFVSSVLNPQPLEQLWDPAAEGTFGHEVLERTFTELEKQHVGACTRAALPQYLEAMHTALDEVEKDLRPPDAGVAFRAFVHGLRIRLEHRLREEAVRGPRFKPTKFEEQFKDDVVVPGVVLTGKCDRIDLSPGGEFVCVVDYKRSGRALDKKGEVYLQIPLYALMAARKLGAEPGGGAYLGVNKKDIDVRARADASPYTEVGKKWLEPVADWHERLEAAVDLAAKTVAKMRSGELEPPPAEPCPPYCLHRLVWR
jgi:RecB family exonuclease